MRLQKEQRKFMALIEIEVAYAKPDKQKIIVLQANEGITAIQAVERSGMVRFFPEISLETIELGIFSQACSQDTQLKNGDRVEIYRQLVCDPKEMRRQRARR